MPGTIPEPRGGKVWLVVAVLAILTLALGVWDLAIERDGGENWLLQVLFPLAAARLRGNDVRTSKGRRSMRR